MTGVATGSMFDGGRIAISIFKRRAVCFGLVLGLGCLRLALDFGLWLSTFGCLCFRWIPSDYISLPLVAFRYLWF
jgi:hypothetical protein